MLHVETLETALFFLSRHDLEIAQLANRHFRDVIGDEAFAFQAALRLKTRLQIHCWSKSRGHRPKINFWFSLRPLFVFLLSRGVFEVIWGCTFQQYRETRQVMNKIFFAAKTRPKNFVKKTRLNENILLYSPWL